MKEEFLHYVWKYQLYNTSKLIDPEGTAVEIIDPGIYNRDSGPDFFNARIRIDGTEWAGNVEIHTRSSLFETHGHNRDHAYDNVILHVVAVKDREVYNASGKKVLTVVIEVDESVSKRYSTLVNNSYVIACQDDIGNIDRFLVSHWLHSLLVERLIRKTGFIEHILAETGYDWEETFYRLLSRYFGFRVNTEPFEMLAAAIPFRIIRKHADNRFQIEALLFGTAGMLDEGLFRDAVNDQYYKDLIKEYKILSAKYSLKPIHGWLWKFSKLRPGNFPTIRISQLAGMLSIAGGLFSQALEAADLKNLRYLFDVSATEYWNTHYIFGKPSKSMRKSTGETAIDILLINSVIPAIFAYGRIRDNRFLSEKAMIFLEGITPEANTVISEWNKAGIEASSAFESQALLQLRNEYCRKRRCLDCRIGATLIARRVKLKKDQDLNLF